MQTIVHIFWNKTMLLILLILLLGSSACITQNPTPLEVDTTSKAPLLATDTLEALTKPTNPAYEPGRALLAFTSQQDGNMEIYSMDADGGSQQRLTNNPAEDYWPTWSPDGAQIAFASNRDGNFEIYVMDADGANLRRLTEERGDDLEPAWSPNGEEIAFMFYQSGKSEIYIMNADGGGRRRLTENNGNNFLPKWSPSGAQIVFVSERDGNPEIYIMNADGSGQRRITENPSDDRYPSWSPDGAWITFFSDRDGLRELYRIAVDGQNLHPVTSDNAQVWVSDWSPDGELIAFTSNRDGNREIYIMASDGGHLQRLTHNNVLDGIPAWRPILSGLTSIPSPISSPSPAAALSPRSLPGAAVLGDNHIRPSDAMRIFFVPAGNFLMGSNEVDPDASDDEFPQHQVKLDSFWIDQTEVTNAQYKRCVEAEVCRRSRYANTAAYNRADYPVVGVAWGDAVDYCSWAGGRLPTEAQWEYAARGGQGFIFPWGNEFDGALANFCDANCEEGWADQNIDDGHKESAPVGSYPGGASWVGALDMAGNVWEWVWDWCSAYPSGLQVNPSGPEGGLCKIMRGGAWASPAAGIRAAYRIIGGSEIRPGIRHPNIGFRCVVEATNPD